MRALKNSVQLKERCRSSNSIDGVVLVPRLPNRKLLPRFQPKSYPNSNLLCNDNHRVCHLSSYYRSFSNEIVEDPLNSRKNAFSTRTFNRLVGSNAEWKQFVVDLDNQDLFPMGELSLEEFLGMESTLNWGLSHIPVSRDSIEEALTIYRRLIQEYEANSLLNPQIYEMAHWFEGNYPRSAKLLDGILTVWYKWWIRHPKETDLNPEEMLALVENLRSGNPPLPLTDKSFCVIIAAASKGKSPKKAAYFADQRLEQLLKESLHDTRLRPSNITLNTVLNAWAKSGLPNAPEKVKTLFHKIEHLYRDGKIDQPPDEAAHICLMQAWSKSGRKETPFKVEEILDSMKNSTTRHVTPTIPAYRLAIHAWVKSDEKFACERVHALFVELINLYMSGDEQMELDADFFSVVISKLARERKSEMAEEVFQLLEQLSIRDPKLEPSSRVLLGMVIAYSKSRKPGSTEKAESILLNLQEKAEANDDMELLPRRGYYGDVIMGLAKSRLSDGADRAEALLYKMIDFHLVGVPGMLPDRQLFDTVILSWSRHKSHDAAQRAEALLNTMKQLSKKYQSKATKPDERSYFNVLTAYGRSKDTNAPERAEKLFYDMLQQHNEGDVTMKPSMAHYTTLVSCWARSGHQDGPSRAQTIFDAAMELYRAGGMDSSFKPDRNLYASLMRAWSKVGEASIVEGLFLELFELYSAEGRRNVTPDTFCFNIMLEAWLNSENPDAHEKARIIFESMLDFTSDGTLHVPPDGITYQLMIKILKNSQAADAGERAVKYLEMFKTTLMQSDRRERTKAFHCYVSTIEACHKSPAQDARMKADALIDELNELTKNGTLPTPSRSEYIHFLAVVAKNGTPVKSGAAKALLKTPSNELKVTSDLLNGDRATTNK